MQSRSTPFVAVIGPFFNGQDHVTPWLKSLRNQKYHNFKVYLINDASTDLTGKAMQEAALKLKMDTEIISFTTNRGPSAARNTAIKKALSDGAQLILLLDMDCRVESDWIIRHVNFHLNHPEIGILGGAIQGSGYSAASVADGFCSWFTAVPRSKSGHVKRLHLSTTNMSIKHNVFGKIGFFDEDLLTGEDVAFCRKARQENIILWFQSDLIIRHLDRNDLTSAKRHHYRWGLHSYVLSIQSQGGYYSVLKHFNSRWPVLMLVPIITALNVVLILARYTYSSPRVWLYLPWIVRLKWANAVGVYQGFINPNLCQRSPTYKAQG